MNDTPYSHPDIKRMREIYNTCLDRIVNELKCLDLTIPVKTVLGLPLGFKELFPALRDWDNMDFCITNDSTRPGGYVATAKLIRGDEVEPFCNGSTIVLMQHDLPHLIEKATKIRLIKPGEKHE